MIGTVVNVATVMTGSAIGVFAGPHLPERLRQNVLYGLGLVSALVGATMITVPKTAPDLPSGLAYPNLPLVVASILAGGVVGELLRIQDRVEQLGDWLRHRLRSSSPTFVEGFVTASMIFTVGAMTVVGSIEDGALGDPTILIAKSAMDGFCSMVLAAGLGLGVFYSFLSVLLVQGVLTLLGEQLQFLNNPQMIAQINGAGGLLIVGISLQLLELRKLPLLNYSPALVLVIVGQLILNAFTG